MLTNSFASTAPYYQSLWCPVSALYWSPYFALSRFVLAHFPDPADVLDERIALAIEYQVGLFRKLSQEQVASRLTLMCSGFSAPSLRGKLTKEQFSLLDSMDACAPPALLDPTARASLYDRYLADESAGIPSGGASVDAAAKAFIKTGGDFPHISRDDEITVHLLVHLRRNGLEAAQPGAASPSAHPVAKVCAPART